MAAPAGFVPDAPADAPEGFVPDAAPATPQELSTAQKIVRSSAPSIIGGAIGAAAGTALTVPTGGIINPVTGAMLGSAGGEAVQQFVDPFGSGKASGSLLQIGVAGAGALIPAAARRFFLSLPGAAAGLQDFLFKKFGKAGERLVSQVAPPPGTADTLFAQARALGAQAAAIPGAIGGNAVPLGRTAQVAQEITDEVARSKFAGTASKSLAKRAVDFASQHQVSFDDFRINQSDVGATVRALERKGGAALGRAKQLYGAMWDDMDAFATAAAESGNPVGATLAKAIDAFKHEEAATFIKDAWVKSTVRRAGYPNIDVDAFMTKIDRQRDVLTKLIPGAEVDDVLATMREVAKIPVMAKTPRLGFEQMPFAERAVVGGMLGMIGGTATGGGSGAVVGGATGVLAVEALSLALASPPGRALVRSMAANGAGLDQIGNALIQPVRAGFSGQRAGERAAR